MTYFESVHNNAIGEVMRAIENSLHKLIHWEKEDNGTIILYIQTNKPAPLDIFQLYIPKEFPYVECKIYASDKYREQLLGVPGISYKLEICTANYSISRPNPYVPEKVIIDMIERAILRIEEGIRKKETNVYDDEFYSYWLTEASTIYLDLILDKLEDSSVIKAYEKCKNYYIAYEVIPPNFPKDLPYRNVIYFESTQKLISPNKDIIIQEVLSNEQLQTLTNTKESIYFIVIKFLNSDIFICFEIEKINRYRLKSLPYNNYKRLNEIFNTSKKVHLDILSTNKYYGRAGQGRMVNNLKPVIILGAGAIGSNLAYYLHNAGINDFIIIDYDNLKYENLGRHIGNYNQVLLKKADVVNKCLYNKFPLIQCKSLCTNYLNELQNNEDMFLNANIIIDATGDSISNVALLNWINNSEYTKNIVFCGVEPYMTMGHIIVANKENANDILSKYDKKFLYKLRCLDKPLSKKEAGCVPYYFEYGGLVFIEYIIKTARIITSVINGKIKSGIFVRTGDISEKFINEKQLELNEMTKTYIKYDGLNSYSTYRFEEKAYKWEIYDIYI